MQHNTIQLAELILLAMKYPLEIPIENVLSQRKLRRPDCI